MKIHNSFVAPNRQRQGVCSGCDGAKCMMAFRARDFGWSRCSRLFVRSTASPFCTHIYHLLATRQTENKLRISTVAKKT